MLKKLIAALVLSVVAVPAHAFLEQDGRCLVRKIENSGRYAQCLLKSDARALRTSDQPAEYEKCIRQFDLTMRLADSAGKGECANEGDFSTVGPYIQDCMSDVMTLLTTGAFESCGDEIINNYELCDGEELGGLTCQDFGFPAGILRCSAGCTFDFSGCTATTCGNGLLNAGEQCDGGQLGGNSCVSLGYSGGVLGCTGLCAFDVSQCSMTTCGNNVLDGYEQCDGTNLGGNTCSSLGFSGGALSCGLGCSYDLSGCVPQICSNCGDGAVSGTEECDLGNLDGASCATQGYGGGVLGCSPGCYFDESGCFNTRFEDLGTTIVDNQTGLEWEKLSNDGSIHDYLQLYTWANASAVKIATLNSANFAGQSDWRLPTPFELNGLENLYTLSPTTFVEFNSGCVAACTTASCSCTLDLAHWTGVSYLPDSTRAWAVSFLTGPTAASPKTNSFAVRAVRTVQ